MQDQPKKTPLLKKTRVLRAIMCSAIFAGSVGAATGTLAWYQYTKRVSVSFTGVAINNSDLIEMGLRSEKDLGDPSTRCPELNNKTFEEYYESDLTVTKQIEKQVVTFNGDTNYIYWIKSTHIQSVLKNFCYCIGSGVDKIPAVTTGYWYKGMEYDLGNRGADALNKWNGFKKTPLCLPNEKDYSEFATRKDYFYLPLAVRVSTMNGGFHYLNDKEVFLTKFDVTDATAAVSNYPNISKGVRCKVDYPEIKDPAHPELVSQNDFVFNPTKTGSDTTDLLVGGALNIERDAYMDCEDPDPLTNKVYEVAYGQFDGAPMYEDTPSLIPPSKPIDECTTFDANKVVGSYALKTDNARVCETYGNSIVNPLMNGDELVRTNISSDESLRIGYFDLSIYLEGWDHAVIDQNAYHAFAISLEFSIQ